jgi:hypothetical protein
MLVYNICTKNIYSLHFDANMDLFTLVMHQKHIIFNYLYLMSGLNSLLLSNNLIAFQNLSANKHILKFYSLIANYKQFLIVYTFLHHIFIDGLIVRQHL